MRAMTQMYTVMIERRFRATHAVRLANGCVEEPHEHDWHVRVRFSRPELDSCGMVIDFHVAEVALEEVLAPLEQSDLNVNRVLGGANPTAEVVARHLFDRLHDRGFAQVRSVEVAEAPGCVAAFERAAPREFR